MAPLTYWDYIRVGELLSLQRGLEPEGSTPSEDEALFIAVHQVYELWFKVALRALEWLRDTLAGDPVAEERLPDAVAHLDRAATVFHLAAGHFELVETLDPRAYLSFRDRLFPASGFQSPQVREIEIVLGLTEEERVDLGSPGAWRRALQEGGGEEAPAWKRVARRLEDPRPSLREAADSWLFRTPIRGSQPGHENDEDVVGGFVRDYLAAHERVLDRQRRLIGSTFPPEVVGARLRAERDSARAWLREGDERRRRVRAAILFLEAYRELPLLSWPHRVLEGFLRLDQAMAVWRQRHARMVERVIGRRVGTGGSSGVDYLDETGLRYRIFPDLFAARTYFLAAGDLPALGSGAYYDFRAAPEST